MKTPNRPPSCDLPPEFYQKKLKPCPFCDSHLVEMIHEGHDQGFAYCEVCNADGPLSDTIDGKSWNAAPRRSELVELLRLVDEVTGWENDLIDTNEFSEDGEAMINDIGNLREYATKLRKEIGE